MGAPDAAKVNDELFGDVPTKDLVPPRSHEIPLHTLANTLAIRAIRRDLTRAARWFIAMTLAFVGGSSGLAATMLYGIFHLGERAAVVEQQSAALEELRARTVRLEERAMRERDHERGL